MAWKWLLGLFCIWATLPAAHGGDDCLSTAACPETDVNCDNITDGFDIAVVRGTGNWLRPVDEAAEPRADVTGDDVIDGFDVAAIRNTECWLRAGFTATELAGHALAEFPRFEYVRAFNETDSIQAAIDPTRFPPIVGRTCDVYVVEAKSASEWVDDPTLVDVRPGGSTTETFDGATIQENTITIAEPFELSSDAGLGIGVGYDIVLDCDRDGELGGGDFIDGGSDEAGVYVVHDITERGPLPTATTEYDAVFPGLTSSRRARLFYPTQIAELGPLPLVVIGHGGGHDYSWYDYLQDHLASYGYVCISHQNTFSLGFATPHIVRHTDAFLDMQDTIAGGVLDGLIDASRIVWIGHSLGGQEAILGYDAIASGAYNPVNYEVDGIKLVSAIGANSLLTEFEGADPHDVVFHMLYGSADGDIDGSAGCDQCQPFRHLDRAEGFKQSTYVHGADHNDFNCCGIQNFQGPPETEIGREEAQQVAKAVYLALVKHYVEGNIPAKDFLWRQWERFHPIGVADSTIVVNIYTESPESGKFVIDDYQTQTGVATSSSGGAVTSTVGHLTEDRLDDNDFSFAWTTSDPMNGMTYGGPEDTTRGVVFDWTVGEEPFMEFEVVPAAKDFDDYKYLSFRACQGTQHPETVAELGDLTFTVTLIDATGAESSMNIGAYGGGIEEVYQRSGGWQNEFETIRLRLTDFLNNGSDLELSDVAAVRFDFGAAFGSSRGRLGSDDVELTKD